MSKVYVIGDKDTGVVWLMLEPLRVAMVSKQEIAAFAERIDQSYEEAFSAIAAASQKLMLDEADADSDWEKFGSLVSGGRQVADADFCFIADVQSNDWQALRDGCMPISDAIGVLGGFDGRAGVANSIELRHLSAP